MMVNFLFYITLRPGLYCPIFKFSCLWMGMGTINNIYYSSDTDTLWWIGVGLGGVDLGFICDCPIWTRILEADFNLYWVKNLSKPSPFNCHM
jgi:hypothetical protein